MLIVKYTSVRPNGFREVRDPTVLTDLNLLTVQAIIAIIATMKSVTALEAKNRFGEVLEAAQRQPVSITRNGRPSVVMISAESYARRQKMASERLRLAMRRAGEHAAAQGMSEDVLGQLLADES